MSPQATNTADRFARAISTSAGLDATLATVCYTSLLLHTHLTSARASSKLTKISPALRNLYNLLEDTRIYTRLTGLVSLYAAIRETWDTRQHDLVSDVLLRTSLVAVTLFQLLENVALLVQQNVLRSRRLRQWEGWLWTASNKFWLASLLCDLARLARARQLGFKDDRDAIGTGGVRGPDVQTPLQIDSEVDSKKTQWWQELLVTAASFPLATNWSFPEGESPVSEALVAGAGLVGGLVMLKDAIGEAV
ncbi:hypothetical protein MBLNU13_g02826t1 [Cladosporium sp. NU13]